MLLAFTDESYSAQRYYQSAFIIENSKLSMLDQALLDARIYAAGFGISSDVEYHGHSIMSAAKGWEPLGNNYRAKMAIYRDVLTRIATLPGTLLIQGVDIGKLNNRYSYPNSPHEVTHKNLMDAIDRYAESLGEKAIIYSDQVPTEERLGFLFSRYREFSTGGPFARNLLSVVSVEFVQSHHHSGIQIADVCAHLYRRMDDHVESNPKTALDVKKLWQILSPVIDRNFPPRVWHP